MQSSKREAAPAPQSVTTYIADMLAQLAQMADGAGQVGWARQIRLAAEQRRPEEAETNRSGSTE